MAIAYSIGDLVSSSDLTWDLHGFIALSKLNIKSANTFRLFKKKIVYASALKCVKTPYCFHIFNSVFKVASLQIIHSRTVMPIYDCFLEFLSFYLILRFSC